MYCTLKKTAFNGTACALVLVLLSVFPAFAADKHEFQEDDFADCFEPVLEFDYASLFNDDVEGRSSASYSYEGNNSNDYASLWVAYYVDADEAASRYATFAESGCTVNQEWLDEIGGYVITTLSEADQCGNALYTPTTGGKPASQANFAV